MSSGEQNSEMLRGYGHLFSLGLAHFKSAAIKCAVELGIPTAIKRCGGAATVSDLIKEIGLVPAKAPYLSRLLRFLAFYGLFEEEDEESASAESQTVYKLTPTSRLLVQEADNDSTCDMSHMLLLFTRPSTTVSTFFNLERWFRDAADTNTVFEAAHGKSIWSLTQSDESFNDAMNGASVADSRFTMEVVINEAGGYFKGLKTLTDVGGGHGAASAAIAAAFPDMQCTVMDLQQVVSTAPERGGTVKFVAGNMFESILPADAVLLKVAPCTFQYRMYTHVYSIFTLVTCTVNFHLSSSCTPGTMPHASRYSNGARKRYQQWEERCLSSTPFLGIGG
jgi:hypothetical protein